MLFSQGGGGLPQPLPVPATASTLPNGTGRGQGESRQAPCSLCSLSPQVLCPDWEPEQFTVEGTCNEAHHLLLRGLLNPVVDACSTLRTVPTLPEDYRRAAEAMLSGVTQLFATHSRVTQKSFEALDGAMAEGAAFCRQAAGDPESMFEAAPVRAAAEEGREYLREADDVAAQMMLDWHPGLRNEVCACAALPDGACTVKEE